MKIEGLLFAGVAVFFASSKAESRRPVAQLIADLASETTAPIPKNSWVTPSAMRGAFLHNVSTRPDFMNLLRVRKGLPKPRLSNGPSRHA